MRFLTFLALTFFASNAFCQNFVFKTTVITEVVLEQHDSQNIKDKYSDARERFRLFNNLIFKNKLAINSQIFLNRFETAAQKAARRNAVDGGDRFFDHHGIILRELNLSYQGDSYKVAAGKFNLGFGRAWFFDHGIWVRDLANQNYRLEEKIGVRGEYFLGDKRKTGKYKFGFVSFTGDSKNFDNSFLNNREVQNKSDVGFSRGLKSWLTTLDVEFDFGKKEELSYHFGYLNQDITGRNSVIAASQIANQKSWVAAINYKYPMQDLLFDALVEYVGVKNFGGNRAIDEKYFTASLDTIFNKNWSVLTGISYRKNIEDNAAGFDQNIFEASLKYSFLKNRFFDLLTIQAGFRNFNDNIKTLNNTQRSLGLLVRYYKNF